MFPIGDYFYVHAINGRGKRLLYTFTKSHGAEITYNEYVSCGWDAAWGEQFSSGDNAMFDYTPGYHDRA